MSLIYTSSQSSNNFDESHTSHLSPGLMWVLGKVYDLDRSGSEPLKPESTHFIFEVKETPVFLPTTQESSLRTYPKTTFYAQR